MYCICYCWCSCLLFYKKDIIRRNDYLNVIKRDGRVVLFDKTKIRDAVLKAFQEVDNNITNESSDIADKISDEIENHTRNDLTIYDIQTLF